MEWGQLKKKKRKPTEIELSFSAAFEYFFSNQAPGKDSLTRQQIAQMIGVNPSMIGGTLRCDMDNYASYKNRVLIAKVFGGEHDQWVEVGRRLRTEPGYRPEIPDRENEEDRTREDMGETIVVLRSALSHALKRIRELETDREQLTAEIEKLKTGRKHHPPMDDDETL